MDTISLDAAYQYGYRVSWILVNKIEQKLMLKPDKEQYMKWNNYQSVGHFRAVFGMVPGESIANVWYVSV